MAANWKMYKTASQTAAFFDRFKALVKGITHCDIVICPPALSLPAAAICSSGTGIHLGGQNMYWEKEGAFTGEISGEMLYAEGASWVLVGHSERRRLFCESDADVLKKTHAAIEANLSPIVCMGERLEEHKAGKAYDVLVRQFAGGIAGLTEEEFAKVAIAYEPVWAIGTGQTATPEIASDAHRLIRSEVEKRFGSEAASAVRIIYGGSVKPDNIAGLMAEEEIDGVLVGGASLDPASFAKIVQAA
jgi:triosephosphate isomerase (TIM)